MVAVGIEYFNLRDKSQPLELLKIDASSCRNLAKDFPEDAVFLKRLAKAPKLVVDTNGCQIVIPEHGNRPTVSMDEAHFKRIFPTDLPYMWVALALSGKHVEVHHATLKVEDFSFTQTTYHRALEEGLQSLGPKQRRKAGTITFVWEKIAPPSP